MYTENLYLGFLYFSAEDAKFFDDLHPKSKQ